VGVPHNYTEQKQLNFKLKTKPKQLLGYLPFAPRFNKPRFTVSAITSYSSFNLILTSKKKKKSKFTTVFSLKILFFVQFDKTFLIIFFEFKTFLCGKVANASHGQTLADRTDFSTLEDAVCVTFTSHAVFTNTV